MSALDYIRALQGDITRLQVEAIVNAANTSLLGGGGVDGAIHRAAGPELLEECRSLGGCPTGEARITKGYRLPAKYVVHTVGPVYRDPVTSAVLLKNCYWNSLLLAHRNAVRTIAFPAVSCGVYGYPIEDACRIAVATTRTFLEREADFDDVCFVLFSRGDYDIYQACLRQLS